MSWQLYTKIVAQLPSNTIIVPFFRGESMLHPQFDTMMEKLQSFETVQLATNGDFLDDYTQKTILNACSFVSLSLHEYRLPNQTDWAKFLLSAKNEGVTTQVSILENLIPPSKKQIFIDSWLKHAGRVRIYVEHSHIGYGDTTLNIQDDGQPCSRPFTEIACYWDGKVALCCQDWNNLMSIGNLNSESLVDVWRNQAYEEIRRKHRIGKRNEVQSCMNCHQWIPFIGELYE